MGCHQELEQRVGFNSYEAFFRGWREADILNLRGSLEGHPAVDFLRRWTLEHDFESCATWTKKLLVELTKRGALASHTIVRAFGHAFNGDEVGALGYEIVGYSLKQPSLDARRAALETLERWCDSDEDLWGTVLQDHLEHEQIPELKVLCLRALEGTP